MKYRLDAISIARRFALSLAATAFILLSSMPVDAGQHRAKLSRDLEDRLETGRHWLKPSGTEMQPAAKG